MGHHAYPAGHESIYRIDVLSEPSLRGCRMLLSTGVIALSHLSLETMRVQFCHTGGSYGSPIATVGMRPIQQAAVRGLAAVCLSQRLGLNLFAP